MAKEETKAPQEGAQAKQPQKLTYEQLASLASNMQGRYQELLKQYETAYERVKAYEMQDYYQRIGLLWDILKNGQFVSDELLEKVHKEFTELLFPEDGNAGQGGTETES